MWQYWEGVRNVFKSSNWFCLHRVGICIHPSQNNWLLRWLYKTIGHLPWLSLNILYISPSKCIFTGPGSIYILVSALFL